jgi:hypothetical protein
MGNTEKDRQTKPNNAVLKAEDFVDFCFFRKNFYQTLLWSEIITMMLLWMAFDTELICFIANYKY